MNKPRTIFLVLLLYALFASTFTIAKTALHYVSPLFLVGTRMTLAGLILLAYCFFFHRAKFIPLKKLWKPLILLGIFNIFFTNAFEFWGLQYLTSSKTCFIYSLSPFISALLSYAYFSEKMTPKKLLGMSIGLIGFIPIFLCDSGQESESGYFGVFSLAEISVFIAAASTVYGWVLMRQLVTEHQYPPLLANAWSMLIGGVLATIASRILEPWDPAPVSDWSQFVIWMVAMTVVSNFICYNLYGHLLKVYTATFMSFAGFTTPLFVSLFGWLFLAEYVTWEFFFSVIIVFIGLTIFYREELKQGYVKA